MLRMTNKENDTALHEAVRYHHPEVVKLLIEEDPEFTYGANLSGGTPLYMAAERGFRDLVKMIIENTTLIPPAHTGPMRRTALHAAVVCHDPITHILFINLRYSYPDLTKEVDENGWSPLHCAAYLGYVSIVAKLLDNSDKSVVYLRVKNYDNKTALHIAATRGRKRTAKLLVSHYPDCCEQVDINGNNVLHLIMMQRRFFKRLIKIRWMNVGALINEKNVKGQTPLHLLADSQLRFRSDYIRNKKVDKMALTNQNLTALDVISLAEDLTGRKGGIIQSLKQSKARVGPLLWQKTMKKGKNSSQRIRVKGSDISFLRKVSDSHMLVATLVATVSFAAGFTLPGGYNDSDGKAILSKKAAFQAFVVSDSMALGLSVTAVLCHFCTALSEKGLQLAVLLKFAYLLTKLGVGAMVVAFLTGLYAVLPHHSGIAILTVIICVCCLVLNYALLGEYEKNIEARLYMLESKLDLGKFFRIRT
ncbi:hypothetical protein PVL29_006672 [Vitis rotundifolia]|uniref:PGG domain-containing protein n=1 Tax=Vitis rotundifolia TaxID=103349 RepID=A0AA39A5M6_VITRO|nr:hypothetical protein PVL29_006672 [Vitis rotundifolia]